MGQLPSYIAYPFKATFNSAFGTNPSRYSNTTYSNMQEFNSNFSRKEEEIKNTKRHLYNNNRSAVKIFNQNILFPYTQLLAQNLQITDEDDPSGETMIRRKKLILIIEKIMELFTTEYSRGFNIQSNNEDICYKERISYVNNNLNRIGRTYHEIQPFLNDNDNTEYDEFERKINDKFNKEFLSKNSIIQYFDVLIKAIHNFDTEVYEHQDFFRGCIDGSAILRLPWHYTVGWFTWLSRSGYSYRGTANFYNYFRNNNIYNLKQEIADIKRKFQSASPKIAKIKNISLYLDHHITNNVTDKFVIEFEYNNRLISIEIKLGYFIIESYETLCRTIESKIIAEFRNNKLENVTFTISHTNKNTEIARDTVLITSNTKFKLKRNSSIMKILGWQSFTDYTSIFNDDKNIYYLLAQNIKRDEDLNEIFINNVRNRHNDMITELENFDRIMDKQRSPENN